MHKQFCKYSLVIKVSNTQQLRPPELEGAAGTDWSQQYTQACIATALDCLCVCTDLLQLHLDLGGALSLRRVLELGMVLYIGVLPEGTCSVFSGCCIKELIQMQLTQKAALHCMPQLQMVKKPASSRCFINQALIVRSSQS